LAKCGAKKRQFFDEWFTITGRWTAWPAAPTRSIAISALESGRPEGYGSECRGQGVATAGRGSSPQYAIDRRSPPGTPSNPPPPPWRRCIVDCGGCFSMSVILPLFDIVLSVPLVLSYYNYARMYMFATLCVTCAKLAQVSQNVHVCHSLCYLC